jgi:adenine phosphoribosyltransferase
MELDEFIREIPDFPKPGILFRDLTPLLGNASALRATIGRLIEPYRAARVEVVAGMEARGFIFGALAAWQLGAGFVPLRKPGKLPASVESVSYDLEYGVATLEVHRDALVPGQRVLLVDDVLATGGTAAASIELVRRLGATLIGCAFVAELAALDGRSRLGAVPIHSVLTY